MVDMAHFAGLVAAGLHPSPVPYADVVTTTTHKTLGGPRGGVILCKDEYAKKINSAVFPGQQGGPLMHVIAAKAVAFKVAADARVQGPPAAHPARRQDPRRPATRPTTRPRPASPCSPAAPTSTWSWSTCATRSWTASRPRTGCTRSASPSTATPCPFDPRPPMVTSGLRIGTPALATRGFGDAEFTEVADIIATALAAGSSADVSGLRARVTRLAREFPLYEGLEDWGLASR